MQPLLILLLSLLLVTPADAIAREQTVLVSTNISIIDVDLVKVDKSARKMHLIQGDRILKSYSIALGANPKGHKLREGDKRTPEGQYTLDLLNEESRFYRSIRINYPNDRDIKRAQLLGVDPGGQIMIHGQKNGNGPHPSEQRGADWTDGCIAIANTEMDEFLRLVKLGTPIDIEW
ncbi:L,D-transpeptidase family protein [Enterovibrio sp. ZSDZ42]|uniref:L,D-transpeptidase family protein n=1 Tax=Enterovibrio gelatinilyticus TaxID=2899819 RepID=A0ABT5R0I7_9GAMM|nr:L,D-transpeptidase family protein [Enterovibrio sp. ZSDZ42]MDD1793680.1 L,D-transpeptidase family protein [Enterovibrio sp. ZSDZ42]